MRKLRGLIYPVVLGCILLGLGVWIFRADEPFPRTSDLSQPAALLTEGIRNPADVIYFDGAYVATELLTNRLAIFDYPNFSGFEYFEPETVGKSFNSPHYLAISPEGGLLVSNGWGSSIVRIDNLKGGGWVEFSGQGREFNAPHGVCVDQAGWIYVGDSLNSRLVRFRDMSGKDWQVFSDIDKKISYIRKLMCRQDGVWIANSYESRPGLNPGEGSNVLRLTDFDSGRVEQIVAIPGSNITGVLPLDAVKVLVGLGGKTSRLRIFNRDTGQFELIPRIRRGLGPPYAFRFSNDNDALFATFTGALDLRDKRIGGIAVYARD